MSSQTVEETDRALEAGRLPEFDSDPWPAEHPLLSGLIVGGAVMLVGVSVTRRTEEKNKHGLR